MSKISEHYPKMQIKTSDLNVGKRGREGGGGGGLLVFLIFAENRRFRTKIPRRRPGHPQAERVALGENLGPSCEKFARVGALGEVLKRERILYV